jgi:hypothetical protein
MCDWCKFGFFYQALKHLFWIATALTMSAFVRIGWSKSSITQTSETKSTLETLLLGTFATVVAYFTVDLLEQLVKK